MIELRQILQSYLESIHSNVFFQLAPENTPFPYVIFDFLPSINISEHHEIVPVDIDVWDLPINNDTTVIETLISSINGDGNISDPTGLNKKTFETENMAVSFYLESKLTLQADNKQLKRRKYSYLAKIFERS